MLHLRQMKYHATVIMSEQEFVQYIQEHQRIIHKICHVYAADAADREDLFQEILMQAWRGAGGFRQESKFSTWLYRIGINTAVSHFRKVSVRLQFLSLDQQALQIAEHHPETSAETEALYRAISNLGKVEKALVMLWLDDYEYSVIADILGISLNNVAVKMSRIKSFLKEEVKKYM